METYEIIAWTALAASIAAPLLIAKALEKRHNKKRQQPSPLLGTVYPRKKKK